jgi:Alpha/beta hydrolase
MVTPADLRRWDPFCMEDAFRAFGAARDRLLGMDAALAAARLAEADWQGAAAERARAAHDRIADQLHTLGEEAGEVRPGLGRAIDAVVAMRADLVVLEGVAAATGFAIGDDGTVTDVLQGFFGQGTSTAAGRLVESALLTGRIRQLLDRAADVDANVHVLLRLADPPPPAPVTGGAATVVAAWWNALPRPEQERFVADHPDQAGNLDGLPAVVRDMANRKRLLTAITDAEARRLATAGQLSALSDAIDHGRQGMDQIPRRDALEAQLERADAHIAVLRALQNRLQAGGTRPAFLLGFQPDVGNGRAIVALGNPDTATNVVTFVPGTSARLETIPGEIGRAEAMADSAQSSAPSQSTAVIAWNGYDAPQSILPDAAEGRFADAAEPLLRSFQDGLRATHAGPASRNTVVGHSYGSTVIGHTARDGALDADALVFAGSPGVGVDDVSGLDRPPGTVYSTTAAADPIEITHSPVLGPVDDALGADPSNPRFGAHVFLADPGGGHSDYWNLGNPSLSSFGRIATGQAPVR